MKNIVLILFLINTLTSIAQVDTIISTTPVDGDVPIIEKNEEILLTNLQEELLDKCFENLQPLEKFVAHGNLSTKEMCSIRGCFLYLYYDNQVKQQMQKRLREIARKHFKDGYFIQLVSGDGSVELCKKENKKYLLNEKVVYIPIQHKKFPDFSETKNMFNNLMRALWDK